jgi:hypothetical protein
MPLPLPLCSSPVEALISARSVSHERAADLAALARTVRRASADLQERSLVHCLARISLHERQCLRPRSRMQPRNRLRSSPPPAVRIIPVCSLRCACTNLVPFPSCELHSIAHGVRCARRSGMDWDARCNTYQGSVERAARLHARTLGLEQRTPGKSFSCTCGQLCGRLPSRA